MKITAIRVHQIDLPLREGRYAWSKGNFVEVFDSTVVAVETDAGLTGWGECCPLGSAYLPSFARGVRAGLAEIAPALIGHDPRDLGAMTARMDAALKGHPYVKAALDVAFWDIFGKVCDQPLYRLLGGRMADDVVLYRAISQIAPEDMADNLAGYRDEGYTRFQLKVGGDTEEDIARIRLAADRMRAGDRLIADANTGWTMMEAARVVNAVRDLDVAIEQPSPSYGECLATRRRTSLPFVLDEVIDGMESLLRAIADGAMDMVNLKISKVGGLTRARAMRDVCVAAGLPMIVEDTWGGDIVTATIAHLAQSTPPEFLFAATDFNSYGTVNMAKGAPRRENGRMQASDGPGLGIDPIPEALGDPVLTF